MSFYHVVFIFYAIGDIESVKDLLDHNASDVLETGSLCLIANQL